MKRINATEFKAKCLAILDEVQKTGERVVVLKHGKPVAELSPAVGASDSVPQDSLKGTVKVLGDIVEPPFTPEEWEAIGGRQE